MVDGLLQPHPYNGIPVEMPLEVHQAIFVANGTAEAMSAMVTLTPAENEQLFSAALFLYLMRAVISDRKLSALLKGIFVDHVTTGSCVRVKKADKKIQGPLVGRRLRCSGCNRTKTLTASFLITQAERLGRSFRREDLPRMVCTGCLLKGGFEVLD
jgi:hypothetical protein